MVVTYVSDLAAQMGIKLSRVSLIEGKLVGCRDTHSLMMSSKGCSVCTIIYQSDLEHLREGNECIRLEGSIREKLARLQMMIEP